MTLKKEKKKKRSQRLRLVEHFVPVQLDLGVEFARRWLLRELVAGGGRVGFYRQSGVALIARLLKGLQTGTVLITFRNLLLTAC